MWTSVVHGVNTYTKVNAYRVIYDSPVVQYDQSNIFFDGINPNMYIKVGLPSTTYTKIPNPS